MNDAAHHGDAPGWPGLDPRWTSSAKSGVGTALSPLSRVWFTLSHGILNEVYYPRVDQACTRDFGLIVTDGRQGGLFAEEKRDTTPLLTTLGDGVPAYRTVNSDPHGRFDIEKCVIADPQHDVVLQRVVFRPAANSPKLHLFALLAPHLVNGGAHNTAWVDSYKGETMLFAEGDGLSLALACSAGWAATSVGFSGASDGWQVLHRHGYLAERYARAANGNVALCGEIALGDKPGEARECVLALGFGRTWSEAGWRARASMQRTFQEAEREYIEGWTAWQAGLRNLRGADTARNTYRISTAVLRTHEAAEFPGGVIASLSIPWGFNKGDDDLGGYHLIWPRDLVETAGGLLAAGANTEAMRVLDYLRSIQEPEGGWPQNCWLDGVPYWRGLQLDECAFPVLLADMALRNGAIAPGQGARYWPMMRAALGFVLRTGPVTGQDRWEEDGGYSPFTLAVTIAALVIGAEFAERAGDAALATVCRDTADAWAASIEDWCYARGTALARAAGVDGHYVRIAPPMDGSAQADIHGIVQIKNRPAEETDMPADSVVSPDALALVRFGIRAADDPRIVATVAVIDHALRRELPQGPCWYRYNGDGYGEHEDGGPFDGTGVGRLWPLMTAERAHYELAAGRAETARAMLATLEQLTSDGGLIPEQVWDSPDLHERELILGRPSGSAMPLVWAHSEHIKLCRSLGDGVVFDMPPGVATRYAGRTVAPRVQPWRPDWRPPHLPQGRVLRLDLPQATEVTWQAGGESFRASTMEICQGLHTVELATSALAAGTRVSFRAGEIEVEIEVR